LLQLPSHGAAVTVSETVVVWLRVLLVPVIVKVFTGVVPDGATVSVEDAPAPQFQFTPLPPRR
jgi:hypothetical protein